MKSAYELALERLNKQNPRSESPLSEEQKKQIAEIDGKYRAKIAERELFLNPQIEKALRESDASAVESLQKQLRNETQSLREEMEHEKEKIRTSSSLGSGKTK